jgi:hypothetical protein
MLVKLLKLVFNPASRLSSCEVYGIVLQPLVSWAPTMACTSDGPSAYTENESDPFAGNINLIDLSRHYRLIPKGTTTSEPAASTGWRETSL